MTALVELILETTVKASIILVLAALATLALRHKSAALRHLIWTVGLFSALALPMFSLVLPVWQMESIRVVSHAANAFVPAAPVGVSAPAAEMRISTAPSKPRSLPPERIMFLCWSIGVLVVASLLLREMIRLARVAIGASVVRQQEWISVAREVSQILGLKRPVRLMRNPQASVLGTWGICHPRVLLPHESQSWSAERRRVVLGHELAHVKRNDWFVQVVAELARAIYWFNPLFWMACAHLRRDSEHACDDTAIRLGGPLGIDGPTYAAHVLDLARSLRCSGQPGAALAMASTSNLERRLVAMLNPSLNRRITGNGTAAIIVIVSLALTLPLAAMQSQVPIPAVSRIRATEVAPPSPAVPIAPVGEPSPAVQRIRLGTVAALAPATPSVYVEPAQPRAAQIATGTFSGTVSDQSGAVLPGVRVILTAQSSGLLREALSTESGNFTFSQLPADTYSATAFLPGFQPGKFVYTLSEGSSVRVKFPLTIAPFSTFVEIAAQAPPGLRCFSVFGAVKSDGTPFTEADCPGGTIVTGLPLRGWAQAANVLVATDGVIVGDSSPPPSTVNGRPFPIRVGGNIQGATLLSHPNPAYPAEARSKGIQGVVTLAGVIPKDGRLQSLKIIGSSNPALETSVLETIQNWVYKPALLNETPVEVDTTITLNFTLGR